MKTLFFVPVIGAALAALPTPVSAQGKLSFEISGGKTFLSERRQTLFRWDDSWTLGVGAAYEMLPGLAITASESYSNFLFRQAPAFIGAPRVSSASVRNVFAPTVYGDNSQMYRTSFGLQITPAQTSVRPFLSLETGISVIHLGKLAYQEFFSPFPWAPDSPEIVIQRASTSFKGFGSFGFGVFAPVSSSIGLKFEGKWLDTWNNGDSYFPLTATVSFQL